MNVVGFLLLISILIIGFAYICHEPIPEGLDVPLSSRVAFAIYRISYILSSAMTYIGYSKGKVYRAITDIGTSIGPSTPADPCTWEETIFKGVAVRIYTPRGSDTNHRRGIMYYHGGGWVLGSIDSVHGIAKRFTQELNAVVVSVVYRKAPEYPFPAAIDDCEKATMFFLENANKYGVDANRIAVAGDSAGGNLAASVSIRLRHQKLKPKLQILIYPITQILDFDTPSYRANSNGPLLTRDMMGYFAAAYTLGDKGTDYIKQFCDNDHIVTAIKQSDAVRNYMNVKELPQDKFVQDYQANNRPGNNVIWGMIKSVAKSSSLSPLFATDLSGVPKAYITTCQYDVLRDDGFFYAKRLRSAGIEVKHDHVEICFHGWVSFMNRTSAFRNEYENMITYIDSNF